MRGRRGRDRMVVGFTYAITTDVVSSNLDQGEVYNIMVLTRKFDVILCFSMMMLYAPLQHHCN
jgi:hypothetical protein